MFMLKKSRFMKYASLMSLAALLVGTAVSCGGGGGDGTTVSSTSQAAASASAAQGAISLSVTVGTITGLAKETIPAGYAPGKSGSAVNTSDIAKLDPQLKSVVDKMVAQYQRPLIKNALSQVSSFKVVNSAPLSAATPAITPCSGGGSFTVTDSVSVSSTITTHNLTVSFSNCKDNTFYDILNGSISATHSIDSSNNTEIANVTAANLIDTVYTDGTFTTIEGTFIMNGTFNSTDNNGTSGTNSANGSFSATSPPSNGDMTMELNFTSVNDVWTKATDLSGDVTEEHTGNGSFGLSVTNNATSQTTSLTVGLTNLVDKLLTYANGDEDEWINGRIGISWSPDMSQWGCLNGNYDFTTAAGTPIHRAFFDSCPSSGIVQINNATIEYGKPAGTQVTVTVNGISEVFTDCDAMGGGICR